MERPIDSTGSSTLVLSFHFAVVSSLTLIVSKQHVAIDANRINQYNVGLTSNSESYVD